MAIPDAERFLFVVFTWGEDSEHHEAHGPYEVRDDNSHLGDVEILAKWWKGEHPDIPDAAMHLFATTPIGGEG